MPLPSSADTLEKAVLIEQYAKEIGFYWSAVEQIIQHIQNACHDVNQAATSNLFRDKIVDEVGDLLHASISLGLYYGVEPQEALEAHYRKFERRLQEVIHLAKQEGCSDLKQETDQYKLDLWTKAKQKAG